MNEDTCVSMVAITKKDSSICNVLPDITPQQECNQDTSLSSHVNCPNLNNVDSVRKECVQFVRN